MLRNYNISTLEPPMVDTGVHKITDYQCISAGMQHPSMAERLYLQLDTANQKELFFNENPKMQQYYLAQDAINNQYSKDTIQKASMKYGVQGKVYFLERS